MSQDEVSVTRQQSSYRERERLRAYHLVTLYVQHFEVDAHCADLRISDIMVKKK